MKKIILFLSATLISLSGFSQTYLVNAASATVTANYITKNLSNSGRIAVVQIIPSAEFVGTTTTDTLQWSLNKVDWSDVLDVNGNPAQHTISHVPSTLHGYSYTFQSIPGVWYRDVFTAGNASAGKLTIIMNDK